MNEDLETIKEVSKATGKAIDFAQEVGSFISKYFSGTIEQGIGIFEDKLKYIRWERQIRLMQKADEFLRSQGLEEPDKPLKLKYAVPLLQAATLEEDDSLQDLWAKLLVNSTNSSSRIELTRTYIDILERLSSLEVRILEKIYSIPFMEMQHVGVITINLPYQVELVPENYKHNRRLENEEVILALADLARLGCISPSRTWGGGEDFSTVNPTLLGKYFIDACTLKK